MDKKIIILSADYGDGHKQVSQALLKQLQSKGIHDVKIMNLMNQSHPFIDHLSRQFYLKSFTHLSSVYGWLYKSTQHLPLTSKRARWLHSFGMNKMKQLIKEEQPDLLIHTFPGSAASELKRKGEHALPIFTVITDFAFHQRWIHPYMDRYFVASEQLKEQIVQAGERAEKVMVSGIPIREDFEDQSQSHPNLYIKYGLSPSKPLIIVLAGAYGVSGAIKQIAQGFKSQTAMEVLIICGKNGALREEMQEMYRTCPHIQVMGYVETLNELMPLATALVTKSGGVTVSEAIASGCPMFFLPPVSGQEEENARFMEERGAAKVLIKDGNLAEQVFKIMCSKSELSNMRESCWKLHESHAARQIAEHVVDFLKEEQKRVHLGG